MAFPVYPSDLNDAEWALLAPLIPSSKPHGRPQSSDMRRSSTGVLYLLRASCACKEERSRAKLSLRSRPTVNWYALQ
jgi:transposase